MMRLPLLLSAEGISGPALDRARGSDVMALLGAEGKDATRDRIARSVLDWLPFDRFPDLKAFSRLRPLAGWPGRIATITRRARRWHNQAPVERASGALPDFLVIGAPRTATTWLYEVLRTHPDVRLPAEKELEFFTDVRWHRGPGWLSSQLPAPVPGMLIGDVSVGALSSPCAIERVAALYADRPPKFIVCLREPVRRAISYFSYRLTHNVMPLTFEAAIDELEWRMSFIEKGRYVDDFEHWLKRFPRDRFHIVFTEDIAAREAEALKGIAAFLNIDAGAFGRIERTNESAAIARPYLHQCLLGIRRRLGVGTLANLVDRLDHSTCFGGHARLPISRIGADRLKSEFEEANRSLARVVGLELPSSWTRGLLEAGI